MKKLLAVLLLAGCVSGVEAQNNANEKEEQFYLLLF
jgi:hypothetical protein